MRKVSLCYTPDNAHGGGRGPDLRARQYRHLERWIRSANATGVPFFARAGFLLSLFRSVGFNPFDFDADIGIVEPVPYPRIQSILARQAAENVRTNLYRRRFKGDSAQKKPTEDDHRRRLQEESLGTSSGRRLAVFPRVGSSREEPRGADGSTSAPRGSTPGAGGVEPGGADVEAAWRAWREGERGRRGRGRGWRGREGRGRPRPRGRASDVVPSKSSVRRNCLTQVEREAYATELEKVASAYEDQCRSIWGVFPQQGAGAAAAAPTSDCGYPTVTVQVKRPLKNKDSRVQKERVRRREKSPSGAERVSGAPNATRRALREDHSEFFAWYERGTRGKNGTHNGSDRISNDIRNFNGADLQSMR